MERRVDWRGEGWKKRDLHSPRVMRSSPPGGMNELWKEEAIVERRERDNGGTRIEGIRERKGGKMNLPAGYWKHSRAVQHGGHLGATPLL